ncbi:hypothetical protein D8M04_16785 [Oceanobacillus piezotolerans]|uniref:YaaC family protein n=1 Tax=Oceanobacillus piezotolerans TaxID=2448030 RepID=A0A498D766_9BACI|nr:YaaC family protein [Oceanobacillus piezotolerans]RLL41724.1 hypothetical protein D8M04_16785 [Oceanobacillus piezotolerans]
MSDYPLLAFLHSQQTAQTYLQNSYQKLKIENPELKGFENSNPFMYYLDHGLQFYQIGKETPLLAKPVLLFYGMTHLLKACLLTKRPEYPESTALLSHGVTTRKRKKKNYTFLEDEVKIQKTGLFPYFAEHLYQHQNIPFEKIRMEDLFSLIPEMSSIFSFQRETSLIPVGSLNSNVLTFPNSILDSFHVTEKAFINKIKLYLPEIDDMDIDQHSIQLKLTKSINKTHGLFFIHMENNKIYFPKVRELFSPISEVMVHYLLLYNLSMICRYETEWWGELLATKFDLDYPLIVHFLSITSKKIPLILESELMAIFNEKGQGHD